MRQAKLANIAAQQTAGAEEALSPASKHVAAELQHALDHRHAAEPTEEGKPAHMQYPSSPMKMHHLAAA